MECGYTDARQVQRRFIESLQKISRCPLNKRRMDNSSGNQPCQHVDELIWNAKELAMASGSRVEVFPKTLR